LRNDGLIRCIDGRCGCLYDSDRPPKDNIKGKCINNVCQWPPCKKKDECVNKACCTAGPSIPSADRAETGSCLSQGTIYKNKYLCDPPEWNFGEVKPEAKVQNIFDLIFNFFSHFLQR